MMLVLGMASLLGALQTIPAVAVMTLAIIRSTGKLAELFVVIGTATCCFAMILYVGTLSDERLSTLPFLSGYMLRGVITGAAGTPLNKHKRLFCSHQASRIFMLQSAIPLFCQKCHFVVATDCQMLMSCRCCRRVF